MMHTVTLYRTETPLDRDPPPRQRTPIETPPGQRPSPWIETPHGRRPPMDGDPLDRDQDPHRRPYCGQTNICENIPSQTFFEGGKYMVGAQEVTAIYTHFSPVCKVHY